MVWAHTHTHTWQQGRWQGGEGEGQEGPERAGVGMQVAREGDSAGGTGTEWGLQDCKNGMMARE